MLQHVCVCLYRVASREPVVVRHGQVTKVICLSQQIQLCFSIWQQVSKWLCRTVKFYTWLIKTDSKEHENFKSSWGISKVAHAADWKLGGLNRKHVPGLSNRRHPPARNCWPLATHLIALCKNRQNTVYLHRYPWTRNVAPSNDSDRYRWGKTTLSRNYLIQLYRPDLWCMLWSVYFDFSTLFWYRIGSSLCRGVTEILVPSTEIASDDLGRF